MKKVPISKKFLKFFWLDTKKEKSGKFPDFSLFYIEISFAIL